MNTLHVIQTLSKIGRIVSKIIFIGCIIGACGCLVGITGLAGGAQVLKLGGVTLHSFLQEKADMSAGTVYTNLATAAIICAGEAVLARFATEYFERELTDGTPFTRGGAKEMQRLGILSVCIPIGTQIIARIVQGIMTAALADVHPTETDSVSGSVAIGFALIIMALLCQYGAELIEDKGTFEAQKENTNE